jgi:hypothetical protein
VTAGVVLLFDRRGAGFGFGSGSISEDRACLLVVRREFPVSGGSNVASESSSGALALRRVLFLVVGGSNSDSASSSSTVLAWLEGTSTIPLDEGFVRFFAANNFLACGTTSSLKSCTSCGFFAFDGYVTLCVTKTLRNFGTVREDASKSGARYCSSFTSAIAGKLARDSQRGTKRGC